MTIYRGLNGVESGTPVDTALEDSVTYENLDANGDVGTDAGQVAIGDHLHTGVYEPADATILKDADIGVTVQARSSVLDNTTASFLAADETKLDGIETAATVDQTGAEIKVAYEAESDTNAFTDAEKTSVGTISGLAPLASPTFTGVPLSPTPATSDDSTKIATTAFVKAQTSGATVGTEVDISTGATSYTITGIPSGLSRITLGFDGRSTNATDRHIIQIGDSGGIETSGYDATSDFVEDNGVGYHSTAGFPLNNISVAAAVYSGSLVLTHMSGNTWVLSGVTNNGGTGLHICAGSKTLSGELTQIKLTTVTGTNTFDAGEWNIVYD